MKLASLIQNHCFKKLVLKLTLPSIKLKPDDFGGS